MTDSKAPHIFSLRYEILSDLGEGGIGKVYRANDKWLNRNVALKALSLNPSDPASLRDLESEFLLLTQLKHPGVVEAYDFGYSEKNSPFGNLTPYFTMEFVDAKSLNQVNADLYDSLNSGERIDELISPILQICDILEFLHLRGIVHCDLKPDNIKITKRAFSPKILDFGLSEVIGGRKSSQAKGTLPYMAPEMFKHEPLDERTDLYSLGVVLYEMVTARLPFLFDDPVKIVSAHLQQEPKAPSELNPNLPPGLNELIIGLLQKSPADRPENALQVKQMVLSWSSSHSPMIQKSRISTENTLPAHITSGPLVGRESEIATMKRDMKKTTGQGGKFLFVSGEPGIGKTLLLRQLRMECQFQGIVFTDSNCLENQTSAYQPIMEILRKLDPYVENRCSASLLQEFRDLQHWPSGGSTSEDSQITFHRKMTKVFNSISRVFPFVVAIENLQWVDLPTCQFLEYLQNEIGKSNFLLCCTLCQEKLSLDTQTASSIHHFLQDEASTWIKLERLDASETKALISSKLIRNQLDADFFDFVYGKTSGNPFFVRELLKYLLEEGVIQLHHSFWIADVNKLLQTEVPATIENVLLKNLERFDSPTVNLLKILSVVGKKFSFSLLDGLKLLDGDALTETLTSLQQHQLLIRKEGPKEKEPWYEFANHSLQDLLYRGLDHRERIKWHLKTAISLENDISGEDDEVIFDIAHHYLEAKMPNKAYHFSLLSAEKMQQRFANQEVLGYLEKAINVSSMIPDEREALRKKFEALMRRADFCKKVGELNRAEEDYLTVLKLMEDKSDLKMLVTAYNGLGEVSRLKHDHKKGISYLEQAMTIHQKLNDPFELAHTLSFMGLLYWIDSQYQKALDCFQQALQIDRNLGNRFYEANTLNNMGLVYWSQRQYPEALKHFSEALSVYKDLDNKEWLARTQNNIGATFFEMGDFQKCIDHFLQSYKINKETKNEKEMAFNLENLSEAYRKMGDHSSALDYGLKGLKLASEINFTGRVGRILKGLGTTYLELGEYHQAHQYLQKAKETADHIQDKELQILTLLDITKLAMMLQDHNTVSRSLNEVRIIIDSIGDEKSLITFYQIKSRLEKSREQLEQALQLLNDALALAEKLDVKEEMVSLKLDLAELYLDRGNLGKSTELLDLLRRSNLERYTLLEPAFHLISGRVSWAGGNLPFARKAFEIALQQAQEINNHEFRWRIHHQLGKLHMFLRDPEGAYREMKGASDIIRQLSGRIKDENLKRCYLNESEKIELLSDLQTVAKQLIGEAKLT